MNTSYFIEWIPSWWTLRFFPVFCHYKQCCRERLCRCPFELKCVAILLSIRVILTYIQPALYKGPIPQLHSPTESHKILDLCPGIGKWYLSVVLFCLSLILSEVEQLFTCLRAICIPFSVDCPYLLSISLLGCWSFSYLFLGTPILVCYQSCFPSSCHLPLTLLMGYICHADFHMCVCVLSWLLSFNSEKCFPTWGYKGFLSCFLLVPLWFHFIKLNLRSFWNSPSCMMWGWIQLYFLSAD